MQKRPFRLHANSLPAVGGASNSALVHALPLPASYGGTSSELTPALTEILQAVQRELGHLEAESALDPSALQSIVEQVSERLGFKLTGFERDLVLKHIERESRPFGIIDDLSKDPTVSDVIIASYNNIQVQQGRMNFTTGLRFPSQEAYEVFVEKLLLKAGTTYSTKRPIADGMLGSFARLHAVHKCIADNGPYLTIRFNRFSSVTSADLLKKGLAPEPIIRYLESVIRAGYTLLIVGEVSTGKTTLARALAASIPTHESILVIEDTPEIRLEHPHVRYVVTRSANVDGEGRVAPSEVIRGGMRMAMNRIIFGEMRDPEAAEAFIDVCASGHPGLSTIHAKTAQDALVRLQLFLGRAQKGVSKEVLMEQISTAVGVIVFVDVCRFTRTRRIMEVREIGAVMDGTLRQKEIFRYQYKESPTWSVVTPVSDYRQEIEADAEGVVLSELPRTLELPLELLYREAQRSNFS